MTNSAGGPTPWFSFGGGSVSIRQDADDTDGRYALIEARKPAGMVTPVHEHLRDRETVYVLEGVLSAQTRDGIVVLGAGEAVTLVEAAPHRLANLSDSEASYLLICRPAGFEALVRRVGRPINGPTAPPPAIGDAEIAQLEAVASDHGIRLLAPDALPPVAGAPRTAGGTPSERFDLIGINVDVIETAGDDEGLALIRATFPPGALVPLHSHREPESFYVLSGRLEVYRAGADAGWTRAGAGDVVTVSADQRHAVRNPGDTPCMALTLTGGRLLRFFREGARPTGSPGGPPSLEEVRNVFEIARSFGYWNGAPADNEAIGIGP